MHYLLIFAFVFMAQSVFADYTLESMPPEILREVFLMANQSEVQSVQSGQNSEAMPIAETESSAAPSDDAHSRKMKNGLGMVSKGMIKKLRDANIFVRPVKNPTVAELNQRSREIVIQNLHISKAQCNKNNIGNLINTGKLTNVLNAAILDDSLADETLPITFDFAQKMLKHHTRNSHRSHRTFVHGSEGSLQNAVISQDGRYLATAGLAPNLVVWDLQRNIPLWELNGANLELAVGSERVHVNPNGRISGISFSSDGSLIAAVGIHETQVFDTQSGRIVRTVPVHYDNGNYVLQLVKFSPDSKRLYIAPSDRKIHVWDIENEPFRIGVIENPNSGIVQFKPSEDGSTIQFFQYQGHPRKKSLENFGRDISLNDYEVPNYGYLSAEYSNDGQDIVAAPISMATNTEHGSIFSGPVLKFKPGSTDPVRFGEFTVKSSRAKAISYSKDGSKILWVQDTGELKIVHGETGELLHSLKLPPQSDYPSVEFHDGSGTLMVSNSDGTVDLFKIE